MARITAIRGLDSEEGFDGTQGIAFLEKLPRLSANNKMNNEDVEEP